MQTVFFSFSFCSLVAFFLQSVGFYYANKFSETWIIKLSAFILFMYIKIYDSWNWVFTIMGLISAFYVSFYVYYGSCNIARYFCSFRLPARSNWLVSLGIICGILSYLIIYWSKYPKAGSCFENYSKLSSVYTLIIIAFLFINLIRERDLTYGVVLLIVMASIIISRGRI
jgi:hypothetical protein